MLRWIPSSARRADLRFWANRYPDDLQFLRRRLDIGVDEIVPDEKQRLLAHGSERVREAVTKIETSGMSAAFAKSIPCTASNEDMLERNGFDHQAEAFDRLFDESGSFAIVPPIYDSKYFEQICRGDAFGLAAGKTIENITGLRFTKCQRQNCRGIDDHPGRPSSP